MDSLVKEKVKAAGLLELPAGYHKVSNQIVLLKDVIDRLDDLRSLNELSGSEREMLAIQRWKAGGWSDVLYCEQLVTLDRAVNEVTKHTKMGQDLVKGSIRAIEMMLVHLQKNNPPSGTP